MADENCKLIEQHIKHLLFKRTPLPCENSQTVSELMVNSLEASAHVDGPHPSLNKGNYSAFNPTVSPQKPYRMNTASHTHSPVSHREDTRGLSNHVPGNVNPNVCSTFSPQNYSQVPPGNAYMCQQMCDIRFLNIQQSEQINGASQSYNSSPDFKTSINSSMQPETICDKAPIASEKLYAEKSCQEVIQTSPHLTGNKGDFKKDAKNKKRKKKDKKKRTRHSPDSSVISESVSIKLDLPGETSTTNSFLQEKFTPLQKGTSRAETPEKDRQFIKRVNKIPFFSEDRESVILRRDGQLRFSCYVCDYNCSDASGISRHMGSSNHKTQLKAKEMRDLLFHLPKPLPKQVESVTNCIIHLVNVYGLSQEELNLRKTVTDRIKEKIETHIPGCHLEPIGSSITGFGLKTSHIDIVLKVPKEKNAADMLFITFERLKQDQSFKDVHNEFRKKIPQIEFVDTETNLTCNICIDNGTVSEFTKLLCAYATMDPRVRVLGTAFRYWAKMCEVDQQDQGTLPSFCYILMLIYFLQQQQPPVLPVIENVKDSDWHSKNTASIGELWLKLFRYYSTEYQCGEDVVCIRKSEKVSCEDKNWGTKILAIEDPIVQRNLAHVIPNRQVYQYIHDCLVQTYNYFGRPQFHTGPAELTCVSKSNKFDSVPNNLGSKNDNRFFQSTAMEKKRRFSEEAPVSDDILNVSDLVEDHDPEVPLDDVISIVNNLTIDEIVSEEEFEIDSSDGLVDWRKNTYENCRTHDMSPSLFANFPSLTIIPHDQVQSLSKIDGENAKEKQSDQCGFSDHPVASYSQRYSWNLDEENTVEEMYYEFLEDHFRGDQAVPLVCSLCQKQGHQKKDCPDEILPAIVALPQMTPEYTRILDSVCRQILEENQPSEAEMRMRDEDLQELEEYIQQIFPQAKLQMFGSFCNGFGFTKSDMDICLTFKDNASGKGLDCLSIIEKLADLLRKNPTLSSVVPITSAKVPIVKFVFKDSGLEGDISLYNTLAQHNTRMLDMYCKIDERVRILGYTLKYFAKILNIGDASRGSLSSYAYILMVLFFLQQRKPPVIPVLQELHLGKQPVLMVDEWNAWFYSDLKNLPRFWADYGNNNESVGELWLGLLRFYTEEFDSNEYVVCIRQKKFLTRFRKLWNSKSIAIEDPFDLSHNLGSGLSRRMNNYILKAFIRGRNHFGLSVGRPAHSSSLVKDFLFDRHVLCEGQDPPNDRGCRYCGKIGHVIKDCPKKTQKKNDQRKPNGPKNQSSSSNNEDQMISHRHGIPDRRGYQRKEDYRRNRHQGNRSPRKNNPQQNVAKGNFERTVDVPPGKITHLLSLQRFPAPNIARNSVNPPPFASKVPSNFVHRPATSTPFPIMNNSALVTSLSPHQNSLTQHTAMYSSSPQNHPPVNPSAQGGISHSLTSQKNVYLPSENSLPHSGVHSNLGLVHLPAGKQQQFRNQPRDNTYGSHNAPGRWQSH